MAENWEDIRSWHPVATIENTDKARDANGHECGSDNTAISLDNIRELFSGKCLASSDGEYAHFMFIDPKDLGKMVLVDAKKYEELKKNSLQCSGCFELHSACECV